jgi:phosphatidate cytidylyltransferase
VDDDDRMPEQEGVRLIGADEAAEALERDDTVRRRRDDEPRFGDRPAAPAQSGPRPTIRFPLGADDEGPSPLGETRPVPPISAAGSWSDDDDTALPHWTDPPTGEVPKIFAAEDLGDDSTSWAGFSNGQPRWRGEGPDSRDDEYDDFSRLADDETRVGAMAQDDRPDPEDFFTFDEDRWDEDQEPALVGSGSDEGWYDEEDDDYDAAGGGRSTGPTRQITSDPRRSAPVRRYDGPPVGGGGGGAGRDMPTAVGVGVVLAAVFLGSLAAGTKFTVVLVAAVLGFAAVELFNVLRQAGYQPAILLGVASCVTLPIALYNRGEAGFGVVMFLTVAFGLIWYLSGAGGEDRPVIGLSSTLLGVAWIGGLGATAALILGFPIGAGKGVLITAVAGTVAYDVGGLFIGRSAGRTPLSAASPNKTMEGLAGGCICALLVTVILCALMSPLKDAEFTDWILLGLGVAIAAPLGDLSESMLKRDLDVKDMGTILPGHGGVLDRVDAMIFVLPTVYYLSRIILF